MMKYIQSKVVKQGLNLLGQYHTLEAFLFNWACGTLEGHHALVKRYFLSTDWVNIANMVH